MFTRFDKAMEQLARAESNIKADRITLESHAQKVRRLEDLIRSREATGDRIVIGLGAALVVSSMALPVYAAFYSSGYAYVPSISASMSMRSGFASDKFQVPHHSVMDVTKESAAPAFLTNEEKSTTSQHGSGGATFARYVIHRASSASALIEGPNGLWWVTPGMKIPGAGKILSIERSDTGWVVVTSETTITETTPSRLRS